MDDLPPVIPDPIDFDVIRALVGADARVILDIGANNGWHSAQFSRMFPQAAIHSFEPDTRAIAKFRERVHSPQVVLHEAAIGAADGTAQFHISSGLPPDIPAEKLAQYAQGWDQSGSLRVPKAHLELWPWCRFEETATVAVRSLDSWAHEHGIGAVDFIWADIQGAAGDMIQGGGETLANTRYLYTEYSNKELYEGEPNLPALLAMLPGFSVLKRYPLDVLLRNVALTESI